MIYNNCRCKPWIETIGVGGKTVPGIIITLRENSLDDYGDEIVFESREKAISYLEGILNRLKSDEVFKPMQ